MVPVSVILSLILLFVAGGAGEDVPTLYEYYTSGGITAGLEAPSTGFQLNKRDITLFSGAMHFFRVHPSLWRDRLRKLRACGLNAVETYVPWNLHNPVPGKYDFGNGSTDMSEFLDIVKYIKIAQEEDLFVLVRPGPYICAEFEFGGMPSWLLRDQEMAVRTAYPGYLNAIKDYYDQLLPLLKDLQFVKGGPILAFQIENEYGSFDHVSKEYLQFLLDTIKENGINDSLFYTSDGASNGYRGSLPELLLTANFGGDPTTQLKTLKEHQPNKPAMTMEYWAGWFDHWTENHHTTTVEGFSSDLEAIFTFPASINIYMFHGGTNWGFLNGANVGNSFPTYNPDVTSYDYDAPLSEAGDYTGKYTAAKRLIAIYNPVVTKLPEQPSETQKVAYPSTAFTGQLSLNEIVSQVDPSFISTSDHPLPMESLPINDNAGQSYGFILYRKTDVPVNSASTLQVMGYIKDVAVVLLDGNRKSAILQDKSQFRDFGYWETSNAKMQLSNPSENAQTLDILVENWGRNNFGGAASFLQRKGILTGPILLDNNELSGWTHVPLEFKKNWLNSLTGWQNVSKEAIQSPTLFHAEVCLHEPSDTFIDMSGWGKGIVFVNGFALGRYFHLGPQKTLYLPAPLLKSGINTIDVFELYFTGSSEIVFSNSPNLG